jgi:hypothetical protein
MRTSRAGSTSTHAPGRSRSRSTRLSGECTSCTGTRLRIWSSGRSGCISCRCWGTCRSPTLGQVTFERGSRPRPRTCPPRPFTSSTAQADPSPATHTETPRSPHTHQPQPPPADTPAQAACPEHRNTPYPQSRPPPGTPPAPQQPQRTDPRATAAAQTYDSKTPAAALETHPTSSHPPSGATPTQAHQPATQLQPADLDSSTREQRGAQQITTSYRHAQAASQGMLLGSRAPLLKRWIHPGQV